MTTDRSLAAIDPAECLRLLRAGVFGRIVLVRDGLAEVFPVNYATRDDAVWIRTTPGSLLDRYADGAPLVLEIDQVDYERYHGWSVVVRGHGERLADGDLGREERRRVPGVPRWVGREESVWIRLPWAEVSGRRIGSGWSTTAGLPVRRAIG